MKKRIYKQKVKAYIKFKINSVAGQLSEFQKILTSSNYSPVWEQSTIHWSWDPFRKLYCNVQSRVLINIYTYYIGCICTHLQRHTSMYTHKIYFLLGFAPRIGLFSFPWDLRDLKVLFPTLKKSKELLSGETKEIILKIRDAQLQHTDHELQICQAHTAQCQICTSFQESESTPECF